jgi:hypothetical protein
VDSTIRVLARDHQRSRGGEAVALAGEDVRADERDVLGVDAAPVPVVDDAGHVPHALVVVVVADAPHRERLAVDADRAGDARARGTDDPGEEVAPP